MNGNPRPPLVKSLFNRDYRVILDQYPLAQAAAAEIRAVVERGESIEDHLRNALRDSPSELAKRRYWHVPLYLQHLLWEVGLTNGSGYTTDPDSYHALVNQALDLDEALFVVLNYDTLLDRCISLQGGNLSRLDHYVDPTANWALVKLHGSVDWAFPVGKSSTNWAGRPPALDALTAQLDGKRADGLPGTEFIVVRNAPPGADNPLEWMRYEPDGYDLFYPALSVPVGSEDEIVCPPTHVEHARARLRDMDGINLLVIGYSGHDQEVLKLLRESGNTVRKLTIVDIAAEACENVRHIIGNNIATHAARIDYAQDGFSAFVLSGGLRNYFSALET